jgi:tetratricopeptide (TPR) repeat protein
MRGRLLALALSVAGAPALVHAGPQPSALPGQPGGDPAPDTQAAAAALKRGRYEDAIAACKRALQRDERYVPALVVMAKSYYYLKKYELSGAIIDLVQKLDTSNAEAYNLLGFLALQRNDTISATAAFKKATESKGDYGVAWNSLAAMYLSSKNYDAALDAAQNAVRNLPNFDKAHLNLGSALRGKQQYPEAEREYRKALELNASYADAYFNLGVLYLDAPKMGELDLVTKLNTAIGHFAKYKNLASYRLAKDDPVDGYIDEARKGIDREQKRLDRQRKQQERDKAKAAQPAAPAPAAPAPAPGGKQ